MRAVRGVLAVEGVQTGDGRLLVAGSLTWADLPLPLGWLQEEQHGDLLSGAVQVGTIDTIVRAGQDITFTGTIDDEQADGAELVRRLEAGTAALGNRVGISIDPDDYAVEIILSDPSEEEAILLASARPAYTIAGTGSLPVLTAAAGDPDPGEDGGEDGVVIFEDSADTILERYTRMRIRGACYDDQTDILTEDRGWQRFADLLSDDRVATRNPKTGSLEWQAPTHYTNESWDGPMIRFSGGGTGGKDAHSLDLLVTPNHRMLVERTGSGEAIVLPAGDLARRSNRSYRFIQTAQWDAEDVEWFYITPPAIQEGDCECGCGQRLTRRAERREPCKIDGCDRPKNGRGWCNVHYQRWKRHGDPLAGGPEQVTRPNARLGSFGSCLPGHGKRTNLTSVAIAGDDFAALMGAWLAEGCRTDRGRVDVAQAPTSRGYAMYAALYERVFPGAWHYTGRGFSAHNKRLADYLKQFGHAKDKFIPNEVKAFSARQLRIFFDHYMAGDGAADGRRAYTSSPRLAGDLQEVAAKLGMWAVVGERPYRESSINGRVIRPTGPSYAVTFKGRDGKRGQYVWQWNADAEHYIGTVACVTVPNEVLYVRRNGVPAWCGNTACAIAAFSGAWMELDGEATDEPAEPAAVTAAASPNRPAASAFALPEPQPEMRGMREVYGMPVEELLVEQRDGSLAVPLVITEPDANGVRLVFGHAARWGACHVGYPGECVTPPESAAAYAHFHVGEVVCDGGERVATGALTVGCDHAPASMRLSEARDHYANAGLGWADVRMSNGTFGPWACGVVRPDVTEAQVRVLRALSLSGDWRRTGTDLEFIAALSVNVPGFPIARESLYASALPMVAEARTASGPVLYAVDGVQQSLVASGIVERCSECQRRASLAAGAEVGGTLLEATPDPRIDEALALLRTLDLRTRHLVPSASEYALGRIRGNGHSNPLWRLGS